MSSTKKDVSQDTENTEEFDYSGEYEEDESDRLYKASLEDKTATAGGEGPGGSNDVTVFIGRLAQIPQKFRAVERAAGAVDDGTAEGDGAPRRVGTGSFPPAAIARLQLETALTRGEGATFIKNLGLVGSGKDDPAARELVEKIFSRQPDKDVLRDAVLDLAFGDVLSDKGFGELKQKCAAGDKQALLTMALVAGGWLDAPGQNGSSPSKRALEALTTLPKDGNLQPALLQAALTANTIGAPTDRPSGSGALLPLIADLAQKDEQGPNYQRAYNAVSSALRHAKTETTPALMENAGNAFVKFAKHWQASDAAAFVTQMNPGQVHGLRQVANRIPDSAKQLIVPVLYELHDTSAPGSPERKLALAGLEALGAREGLNEHHLHMLDIALNRAQQNGDGAREFAVLKELARLEKEVPRAGKKLDAYAAPDGKADAERGARVELMRALVKDPEAAWKELKERALTPEMLKAAGDYLTGLVQKGKSLTSSQTEFLVAAFKKVEQPQVKDNYATLLASALQNNSNPKAREIASKAVADDRLYTNTKLLPAYAKMLSQGALPEQLEAHIKELSGGDQSRAKESLLVLTAVAATADRPDPNKPAAVTEKVMKALVEYASSGDQQVDPKKGSAVVDAVIKAVQLPESRPGQISELTLLAARLSAKMPVEFTDPRLVARISQDFEKSLNDPKKPESERQREAFLLTAAQWDQKDAKNFLRVLSDKTGAELAAVFDKLSPAVKRTTINTLCDLAKANVEASPKAIQVLLKLGDKVGAEGAITLKQLGVDAPIKFNDPLARPSVDEYKRLWEREFDKEGFPRRSTADGDEYGLWHRDLWMTQARNHFEGQPPGGLQRLKNLVYEDMAFHGGDDVSLREIYCATQYIENVQAYERAVQAGDKKAQQLALVDILALQKSPVSRDLVDFQEVVRKYLDNEKASGRVKEQDITAAFQELQRRNLEAESRLSESISKVLTAKLDGSAESYRQLRLTLAQNATEAGFDLGGLSDYLRLQETKAIIRLFDKPGAEKDPKNLEELQKVLSGTGQAYLLDGIKETSQIPGVIAELKKLVEKPECKTLEKQIGYLKHLPITALDAMRLGAFAGEDRPTRSGASAFAALRGLSDSLKSIGTADSVTAEKARELATVLEDIKSFKDTMVRRRLEEALGGPAKFDELVAGLQKDATAKESFQKLTAAMASKPAKEALGLLDAVVENPNLVAAGKKQGDQLRSLLDSKFLSLFNRRGEPSEDTDAADLKAVIEQWRSNAAALGPGVKDAWPTVEAALAVRQLKLAAGLNLEKDEKQKLLVAGLENLLEAGQHERLQGVIQAVGGKEQLTAWLKAARAGDTTIADKLSAKLDAQPVAQLVRDVGMLTRLPADVLSKPLFSDRERMDKARCYLALDEARDAFLATDETGARSKDVLAALDRLLAERGTAIGRQAMEKLGGVDELTKLRANIEAGIKSGDFRRPAEQIRAICEKTRQDAFESFYKHMGEELNPSKDATKLLGRPQITRTEVAEAVESLKVREAALNTEYDRLEKQFLARPKSDESVADTQKRREEVLAQIERFGLDHFVQGGDDRRMTTPPELRAVHTLKRISEATDPKDQAAALRDLIDLSKSGNSFASNYVEALRKKQGGDLENLLHALERGSEEAQRNAAADLKKLLPNAEELLDNVRSRACVRDVVNAKEPRVADYDAAKKALQAEVEFDNLSAQQWMKWVEANRDIARLSALGGGESTVADRKAAVESLVKQMNAGNPYARDALFNALTANTRYDSSIDTDGRAPKTPDLSHLTADERKALLKQVVDGIDRQMAIDGPKARLTNEETHALAIAAAHNAGDGELRARIATIVDRAYRAGSGKEIVDGLIWTMAEKALSDKGRQAVGDLLINVSDHPEFGSWGMSQVTRMAAEKDAASMYVIGGLLAKEKNPASVEEQLKLVVPILEKSPQHAAVFTQAMIERHRVGGDDGHLLETLGRVAANPDAKISPAMIVEARAEIRAGFERCFRKSDGKPDAAFAPSLASAARGLASLVKHWEAEDVGRLTKHMTPETAEAIKMASKDVPDDFKDMLVNRVMKRLRDTEHKDGEWIPGLQAIASLAPYVQLSQFKEITAFQKMTPESDTKLQMQLSRSILAFVNNGNKEVRDAAADHFTRTGWAQQLGPEVTKELVKFAQGKDINPELLGRISELAYEAGIKPPISHLLRSLGMTNIDKEKLEKAIQTAGGDEKFRDLLARVITYDSLPKTMQDMLKAGAVDISKLQAPDLMPMAGNRGETTDLSKLVEGLSTGKVPDQYKFLVSGADFDKNVRAFSDSALKAVAERSGVSPERLQFELTKLRMQALTGENVEIKDKEADAAKDSRKKALTTLCDKTKEGHDTSLWWLALGPFGPSAYMARRQYNIQKFEAEQKNLIAEFKNSDAELSRIIGDMRRLQAVNELADLSRDSEKQFRLAAGGDRLGADKVLLKMGAEYSMNTLQALAPLAYKQLTGFGLEPWQQGAWNRMYLNGLVAIPMLTQIPYGKKESVKEGLAVLTSPNLETRLAKDDPRRWTGGYYDITHGARTLRAHEALRAIDSHPAVADVTNASAELTKTYGDLEKLVAASIKGHRGPDMVNYVRGLVSREENGQKVGMEACIEKIQKNLPQVKDVIKDLRKEVDNISDPEAKKAVEKRIETLQKLVDNFSYNSPQMEQFREMARLVRSGSMDESTFWTLMRDNIIPIAGTIAIAALVVATCGAATPLAIIGGACLMAAGGLLFREGYAEFCYQMDWNGTGGAQICDAARRREHELGMRDSHFLVFDAQSGKFTPGPTFTQALGNYAWQFGSDVVMNLALMGFGSLVGKGLRAVSGVEGKMTQEAFAKLMGTAKSSTTAFEAAAKELPEVTKALWKRWLGECGNQVAFAMASHATEDALKHGFNAQNFFTQIAAALVVCAGHQTLTHGMNYGAKGFVPKWLKPNHLEVVADRTVFMEQMQERVAKLNKEMLEVDPKSKPITIDSMPNGNIRCKVDGHVFDFTCVKPEVAIARAQREARELAEGAGKSDVTELSPTPEGRPCGWEKRRVELPADKAAEVNGTPLSERAKIAREQMDKWADLTAKGQYGEAAEHSLGAARDMETAGKATVKFIEVEIPAGKLKENIGEILQKMGGEHGGPQPGVKGTSDHVDITIARPKLELSDGTKVDLTRISAERARLKEGQRAELDALLQSHEGQQLLQRMARQQMEEVICHANRILGGDKPLSVTQAKFSQAVAGERPEGLPGKESLNGGADRHREALKGKFDAKIAEQEVLALMFERGAKWSDVAAVAANGKHLADRATLLEFLKHTHCQDAGIKPNAVPGAHRLPGSPGQRETGAGSELPRSLLGEKVPTDISPAERAKVEATRDALAKKIDEAGLPTTVAEALRALVPPEVAATSNGAQLGKQAKDLALLHDILNVPPEIRVHLIDQLVAGGAPAAKLEQALSTARTCAEMVQAGVPMESIKSVHPEILDRICLQMETVPARIREAYLDPVMKKGFNTADFEPALAAARDLARLSPTGQLEHLSARLATEGGAKGAATQELLLKTAREVLNSKEYAEAKAKSPFEREAEQNRIMEAMEKTRESLGIPKEKWDAAAEALKKASRPEEIAAVIRDSIPPVRDVFEPAKPTDLAARKPFGTKEEIVAATEKASEKARTASDAYESAKTEAANRQQELETLLKPEMEKIRVEREAYGDKMSADDCRALALDRARSHPDSPLAVSQKRVAEAQAKVSEARRNFDRAVEQAVESLGNSLGVLRGPHPEFGAMSLKLSTEPTAQVGLKPGTREIVVTPEIMKLPPEQLASFVAREAGRAKLEMELATQLAYGHNPGAQVKGQYDRADVEGLRASFKRETGIDLSNQAAVGALKRANQLGAAGKMNNEAFTELAGVYKSTRLSEFNDITVSAHHTRQAAEQVNGGNSRDLLQKMVGDEAFAKGLLGEPLPGNVKALMERARAGETVDPVTAQRALREALDARQAELNQRLKSTFEKMSPREQAIVADGQAAASKVSPGLPHRMAQLEKSLAGTEPWKSSAREALESMKGKNPREVERLVELLELRALKETDVAAYEKAKAASRDKGPLEALEAIERLGDKAPALAEIFKAQKPFEVLEQLGAQAQALESVRGLKDPAKRNLAEAILLRSIKDMIPLEPLLLKGASEENLRVLDQLLHQREALTQALQGKNQDFAGLGQERLQERLLNMKQMLDRTLEFTIKSKVTEKPGQMEDTRARLKDVAESVQAVTEMAKAGQVERAQCLADLIGCARDYPPLSFPCRALTEAAKSGPLDVVQFARARFAEVGAPPQQQSVEAMLAVCGRGVKGYEEWIFIPTGGQSMADHANMDGLFLNMKTGESRPIDFFAKGGESKLPDYKPATKEIISGKDFWAKDSEGHLMAEAMLRDPGARAKVEKYVIDFMKSTEEVAAQTGRKKPGEEWWVKDHTEGQYRKWEETFTPPLKDGVPRVNENQFPIEGSTGFTRDFLTKVGFPPFKAGHDPNTPLTRPQDLEAQVKAYKEYYEKLCAHMREVYAKDGVIPAHVAQLAESVQRRLVMGSGSETQVNTLVTRMMEPVPGKPAAWEPGPKPGEVQTTYTEKLDTGSTIKDFLGNTLPLGSGQTISGVRLCADGTVAGVGSNKRPYPVGKLTDVLEMVMQQQGRCCSYNPSPENVAALRRTQQQIAFIREELAAGRSLDYSKPPLSDIPPRLGR